MIWIIIGIIILIIFAIFYSSLNKDVSDLQGRPLSEKFKFIVNSINEKAFEGNGKVVPLDKRRFNLYEKGSSQIIQFVYSTGHLTITWRYKYFQKEIVHEKVFRNVRNISLFEQQKIADVMITEMEDLIQNHQNKVINEIL